MTKGPVLIELDSNEAAASPSDAPPVPEVVPVFKGEAMHAAAGLAARRPSRLVRLFWSTLLILTGTVASVLAWDFVTGLMARSPILGWGVVGLLVVLGLVLLVVAIRELAAFSRIRKLDQLQMEAEKALVNNDLESARHVTARLQSLYSDRDDTRWGRDRFADLKGDQFDAQSLIELAEVEILASLDDAAMREVEAAARQVALVTAVVPLAFADVLAALTSNIRMIRRISEVYGGRSGTLGSWRLTRAVLAHLVATGAVAVGDDLIGSIAGGGILSKLSRRFGEGIVNGALTARVGVAAMEVCRPLPFSRRKRPSVTALVKRALAGLFQKG